MYYIYRNIKNFLQNDENNHKQKQRKISLIQYLNSIANKTNTLSSEFIFFILIDDIKSNILHEEIAYSKHNNIVYEILKLIEKFSDSDYIIFLDIICYNNIDKYYKTLNYFSLYELKKRTIKLINSIKILKNIKKHKKHKKNKKYTINDFTIIKMTSHSFIDTLTYDKFKHIPIDSLIYVLSYLIYYNFTDEIITYEDLIVYEYNSFNKTSILLTYIDIFCSIIATNGWYENSENELRFYKILSKLNNINIIFLISRSNKSILNRFSRINFSFLLTHQCDTVEYLYNSWKDAIVEKLLIELLLKYENFKTIVNYCNSTTISKDDANCTDFFILFSRHYFYKEPEYINNNHIIYSMRFLFILKVLSIHF